MTWIKDVNWITGPLLQITLLVFMIRNGHLKAFPRFFSYILFQTLKSVCLFLTYRYFPDNYFDVYWTGNALSVIFALAVMDEILRRLFREYGGIQFLGTTIFRWSCVLLLLVAIVGAASAGESSGDRIVAVVFAFDRSVRLMQVGIFLLLMLLSRVLKDCWKQPVFGIALGFGIFASIELVLVSFVMLTGNDYGAVVSLIKMTAYNAVTLVWIGYLRWVPEPAAESNLLHMPVTAETALAADAGFMLRVEDAVDRVLSRSEWPRPAVRGARIVGRKPTTEERN